MIRGLSSLVLLLLVPTFSTGQENPSPPTTERVPCTLRPVNGRVCLNEGSLRGFLLRYVPPKLPEGGDENGVVLLHVIVPRTGGKPTRLSTISGDPALVRSAIRAVREWVFMGYLVNGKNVEMEGDLHVRFKTTD